VLWGEFVGGHRRFRRCQAVKGLATAQVRPANDVIAQAGSEEMPYSWYNPKEVTDEILEHAEALTWRQISSGTGICGEPQFFAFEPTSAGTCSCSGEETCARSAVICRRAPSAFIVRVPPFPPELKILSQGSLLALSGEHKVVALVRDLPGVRVEVARLLPAQLQHLVSQSNGDFANQVSTAASVPTT